MDVRVSGYEVWTANAWPRSVGWHHPTRTALILPLNVSDHAHEPAHWFVLATADSESRVVAIKINDQECFSLRKGDRRAAQTAIRQ